MYQAYNKALESKNSEIFVEFVRNTNLPIDVVTRFTNVYPLNF